MLWPRAIGLDSCFLGLTFLKEVAMAECVIDPFCGVGTYSARVRTVCVRDVQDLSYKSNALYSLSIQVVSPI